MIDLRKIPGVGENIAQDLREIGIACVEDLIGKVPEELYRLDCLRKGFQEDRCQLYVFRCAVYYAEHKEHEPEKLKWWYWKDKEYPEREKESEHMLDREPGLDAIKILLNEEYFSLWTQLCSAIEKRYEMEHIWNRGGKDWIYEYKYRRGGKTLCAVYARENCIGFMVILGKAEREKFEARRQEFPVEIQRIYDEAKTYHDGKWIMFYPESNAMFDDFMKLLEIKRKPNQK